MKANSKGRKEMKNYIALIITALTALIILASILFITLSTGVLALTCYMVSVALGCFIMDGWFSGLRN